LFRAVTPLVTALVGLLGTLIGLLSLLKAR
jgi:hypothetical protein